MLGEVAEILFSLFFSYAKSNKIKMDHSSTDEYDNSTWDMYHILFTPYNLFFTVVENNEDEFQVVLEIEVDGEIVISGDLAYADENRISIESEVFNFDDIIEEEPEAMKDIESFIKNALEEQNKNIIEDIKRVLLLAEERLEKGETLDAIKKDYKWLTDQYIEIKVMIKYSGLEFDYIPKLLAAFGLVNDYLSDEVRDMFVF